MEKLLGLYKLSAQGIIQDGTFFSDISFVRWNDNKNLVKMKSTYDYHITLMFISTR